MIGTKIQSVDRDPVHTTGRTKVSNLTTTFIMILIIMISHIIMKVTILGITRNHTIMDTMISPITTQITMIVIHMVVMDMSPMDIMIVNTIVTI